MTEIDQNLTSGDCGNARTKALIKNNNYGGTMRLGAIRVSSDQKL